ncbi:MAG: Rieske 2Fe-2S domain-containing protein [Chloroflexota bacterium]
MSDDLERLSRLLDDLAAERDPEVRRDLTPDEVELARAASFLKAARPEAAEPRAEFLDQIESRLEAESKSSPSVTKQPGQGVSRRGMLGRAVAAAMAGLGAGAVGGAAAAYDRGKRDGAKNEAGETLTAPMVPSDRGVWMDTGHTLAALKPGQALRFRAGAIEGFVVNPGHGEAVYAVSAACTHMGCAISWMQQSTTFLCPCHGAQYNADGTVLSGIARHPLPRLKLEHWADDHLWVWSVSEHPTTTTPAPYDRA